MLYLISLNPLLLKNIAYVGNLLFLHLSLGYLGFSIFTVRPSLSDNSYIGCWLERIFSQFWQISWKGGKGRKCPGSSAATRAVNRRLLIIPSRTVLFITTVHSVLHMISVCNAHNVQHGETFGSNFDHLKGRAAECVQLTLYSDICVQWTLSTLHCVEFSI